MDAVSAPFESDDPADAVDTSSSSSSAATPTVPVSDDGETVGAAVGSSPQQ